MLYDTLQGTLGLTALTGLQFLRGNLAGVPNFCNFWNKARLQHQELSSLSST